MRADATTTKFLNVDLEIRLDEGLADLLSALGKSMFVLASERDWARLELNSTSNKTLEKTLQGIVKTIDRLPPAGRALWNACRERRIDIGIQAGAQPHAAPFTISHKAVEALASCRLEIGFTIYGHRPPQPRDSAR